MSKKLTKTGVVEKNKSEKTVVVRVSRMLAHPLYNKRIVKSRLYHAHSENPIEVGTEVVIQESKPISKMKRWKVIEILDKDIK